MVLNSSALPCIFTVISVTSHWPGATSVRFHFEFAAFLQMSEQTIWIHPKQPRLVRIDGQLTSDVKFGGGLLSFGEAPCLHGMAVENWD